MKSGYLVLFTTQDGTKVWLSPTPQKYKPRSEDLYAWLRWHNYVEFSVFQVQSVEAA
jgi:hypothetical protein